MHVSTAHAVNVSLKQVIHVDIEVLHILHDHRHLLHFTINILALDHNICSASAFGTIYSQDLPNIMANSTHSHPKASYTDAFANAYTSNTHGTL